jgi:hypothetical protein
VATASVAALSTISRAIRVASATIISGGQILWIKPAVNASSDRNVLPLHARSRALLKPTMRGRNQEAQASGTMPLRTNVNAILHPGVAKRTSMGNVIVMPIPTAAPLIAEMQGLRFLKTILPQGPPV